MKTLTQILDEKAKELGYKNFEAAIKGNHLGDIDTISKSAAIEYAESEIKTFIDWLDEKQFVHDRDTHKWEIREGNAQYKWITTTELYHSEEFKKFKEGK